MDTREMEEIGGAAFVKGDFRKEEVLKMVVEELEGFEADLVYCDIADEELMEKDDEDKSGSGEHGGSKVGSLESTKVQRKEGKKKNGGSNEIAWKALEFVHQVLRCGGSFVCRTMKAEARLRKELENYFVDVWIIRPWSKRVSFKNQPNIDESLMKASTYGEKDAYYYATGFVPKHLQTAYDVYNERVAKEAKEEMEGEQRMLTADENEREEAKCDEAKCDGDARNIDDADVESGHTDEVAGSESAEHIEGENHQTKD